MMAVPRVAGWACLFAVLAGCWGGGDVDGGGAANPPPSTFSPWMVEAGTWMAVNPVVEPWQGHSWHVNLTYAIRPYESYLDDGYLCGIAATPAGWLPGWGWGTAYRDIGSEYVAARAASQTTWNRVHYGDVGGDFGLSVLGRYEKEAEATFMVAHDRQGAGIEGAVFIDEASVALDLMESGSYWCLSGVSPFLGGSFRASPHALEADDLHWTQEMRAGILVRVEARVSELSLALVGPDGTLYPLPPAQDGTWDQTLCVPDAGTWTIEVGHVEESSKPWSLTLSVFDTDRPIVPCAATWSPSPLVESAVV